jgi:putative two-component system response regulator
MTNDPRPTILIVDDDANAREVTSDILGAKTYHMLLASNGAEALLLAKTYHPDLVLLDVMMPGINGFELCRMLRDDPILATVPIIMVTALDDRRSRLQGFEAGIDDFLAKPIDSLELRARVRSITRLNRYRQLLEERSAHEQAAREQATAVMQAYDTTLVGWSRALDLRDKETEGHSQRVTSLTVCLAQSLGISGEELKHIKRGSLLHDIGKLGIPDSILLKPGPLTPEEWEIMRRHPIYALELLQPITFLAPALDIPYYHHERWDGNGYPCGLAGEQIPLAARMFALADVWDALTHDRPYRAAWSIEQSAAFIREQSGKHFDPALVEPFLTIATRATEPCYGNQEATR